MTELQKGVLGLLLGFAVGAGMVTLYRESEIVGSLVISAVFITCFICILANHWKSRG